MAIDEKQRKKSRTRPKGRVLGIVFAILLLAIASLAAAVIITNNGRLDLDGLKHLLDLAGNRTQSVTFSYDAGSDAVYGDLDGGFAVCSSTGLQVFDASAAPVYDEAFEMTKPTISAAGKTACVYDLSGKMVKVFDQGGVKYSLTADNRVVSATLTDNGWLALCTESSGVYKGTVSVYDPSGRSVYKFDSAKAYVLSAVVSPDHGSLAVLTLNEGGSRLVFFSLGSSDEKASCQLDKTMVLELRYLNTGSVLAVGDSALYVVHPDGSQQQLMDYHDKNLANYATESAAFTALVLNDYMVGDQGKLVTVDKAGNTLGSLQTTQKVLWLSANGDNLAVLYADGLVIYDKNLKQRARFDDIAGAEQTIMRADGAALLVLTHSAMVYAPTD